MSLSAYTFGLLIDAGLSNEKLKAIAAAIESDVEFACNMLRVTLREQVTLSDAGSVTPAALRMRKMRENKRFSEETGSVTERNSVTSQPVTESVTSYNILSKKEGFEEVSKEVVIARGRKKITYSELFEKFWAAFPTDKGMSKLEAWKVWEKLPDEDHQAAIGGISGFKKWASEQGATYRMVHACRYLSQRRFDGFKAELSIQGAPGWHIMAGTQAWDEWEAFYLKTKGKKPQRDLRGGWYFPSQFPPAQNEDAA